MVGTIQVKMIKVHLLLEYYRKDFLERDMFQYHLCRSHAPLAPSF